MCIPGLDEGDHYISLGHAVFHRVVVEDQAVYGDHAVTPDGSKADALVDENRSVLGEGNREQFCLNDP
jgi:hypothetical protein